MTYVLAGNFREYQNWLRKRSTANKKTTAYVFGPETLVGARAYRLVRWGTWFERYDRERVLQMHQINRLRCPEIEG